MHADHPAAEFVLMMSNAPDIMLAKRIAHILVEEGLAACVNLGPATLSMYGWAGQLEGSEEIPLTIKTAADRAQDVAAMIERLHPYEVPEILVLPIIGGSVAYLDWIKQQTRGPLPTQEDSV